MPQASPNGLNWLLGLYTLMLTVPIAELVSIVLHAAIPFALMTGGVLTLGLVIWGHFGEFWRAPMAKPWMIVALLFSIAAVLGQYKSVSIPFIATWDVRFHIFPFYCCAIALTVRQVRKVLLWVGWGSMLLLVLCAKFGEVRDARFFIPDTSLENPNDLAFAILFVMSCLVLFKSKVQAALALLSCPLFFYYILKTGSRANLITLVAMIVILFLVSPARTKGIMALGIPVVAAILLVAIPGDTLSRLELIFKDNGAAAMSDDQLKAAMDSQAARAELQKRAMELSLHYPLFGVGAEMLLDAIDAMVEQETGHKSGWQGAHNTYLYVAAENGIPALIFYVITLFLCAKVNYQTYQLCRREPLLGDAASQSLALILMTVAFVVCVAFSNNAYDPRVCVLVGMSAANFLAVRRELPLRRQLAAETKINQGSPARTDLRKWSSPPRARA